MDRKIEPSLEERSKARLSVLPLIQKLSEEIRESFNDAISKIKVETKTIDFPPVQQITGRVKVENLDDIKIETQQVKIIENKVNFPDTQTVSDPFVLTAVEKLQGLTSKLYEWTIKQKQIDSLNISNLPLIKYLKGDKKQNAIPVKIVDQEFMIPEGGGGQSPFANSSGRAVKLQLTENGKLPVELDSTTTASTVFAFMGLVASGGYTYIGKKQNGGTNWFVMRMTDSDDGEVKYAYGDDDFTTAWTDPSLLSYDYPPDS